MISEKSIIFSTEMVKAILEVRINVSIFIILLIKPQPRIAERKEDDPQRESYLWKVEKSGRWKGKVVGGTHTREEFIRYAPYQIGDHLWVKETYCHGVEFDNEKPKYLETLCGSIRIWYFVDGPRPTKRWGKTRSSLFMPRWVARIWLEVINVRPERLQDINGEDLINADHGYSWESNPWVWRYEFIRINK
jgi:hypothetical protein